MPISEPTAVFSIRDDRDMEIKQAVLQAVSYTHLTLPTT